MAGDYDFTSSDISMIWQKFWITDYKLRKCPVCRHEELNYSVGIWSWKFSQFPEDMCHACASNHLDLSTMEW